MTFSTSIDVIPFFWVPLCYPMGAFAYRVTTPVRRKLHRALKKHFIPHKGNKYHPHILHAKRTVFYGAFFLLLKGIAIAYAVFLPVDAYLAPDVLAAQSNKIFALTNEIRADKGLPALNRAAMLEHSSQMRADDMAEREYFSHKGPDGHVLSYFLSSSSYKYSTAGENLAMGFTDADAVVNGWLKSPTHYANLIDGDYLEIGVGLQEGSYEGKPTVYVAQHFGLPLNTAKPESVVAVAAVVPPPTPESKQETIVEASQPVQKPVETAPIQADPSTALGMTKEAAKPTQKPVVKPVVKTEPVTKPEIVVSPTVPTEVKTDPSTSLGMTDSGSENPVVYEQEKSSVQWSDTADGRTHVEVAAYFQGEPESVTALVRGYPIELASTAGVYTGSLTVPESSDEIFKTVVGSTIAMTDKSGFVTRDVIDWDQPKVVSETPWQKYKRADAWFSPVSSFFSVIDNIYLAFFAFFSIALLISLSIEIKKQHPHVITRTVGLLALLIFLIWR